MHLLKENQKAYSEAVKAAIIGRFPTLADGWIEHSDGTSTFTMKSPSGGDFWIELRGSEIIVGFEFPHRHIGTPWLDDPDPQEDAREAEGFIRDLFAGKYKAVTWTRNGKYVQSMLLDRDDDPAATPMSWLGRWWTCGCTIDVRHWAE
jgi:hypothetical protein